MPNTSKFAQLPIPLTTAVPAVLRHLGLKPITKGPGRVVFRLPPTPLLGDIGRLEIHEMGLGACAMYGRPFEGTIAEGLALEERWTLYETGPNTCEQLIQLNALRHDIESELSRRSGLHVMERALLLLDTPLDGLSPGARAYWDRNVNLEKEPPYFVEADPENDKGFRGAASKCLWAREVFHGFRDNELAKAANALIDGLISDELLPTGSEATPLWSGPVPATLNGAYRPDLGLLLVHTPTGGSTYLLPNGEVKNASLYSVDPISSTALAPSATQSPVEISHGPGLSYDVPFVLTSMLAAVEHVLAQLSATAANKRVVSEGSTVFQLIIGSGAWGCIKVREHGKNTRLTVCEPRGEYDTQSWANFVSAFVKMLQADGVPFRPRKQALRLGPQLPTWQSQGLPDSEPGDSDIEGEDKPRTTEARLKRAHKFREIKDANPAFSYAQVAIRANREGYPNATDDHVRNDYRMMGWHWQKANKTR